MTDKQCVALMAAILVASDLGYTYDTAVNDAKSIFFRVK